MLTLKSEFSQCCWSWISKKRYRDKFSCPRKRSTEMKLEILLYVVHSCWTTYSIIRILIQEWTAQIVFHETTFSYFNKRSTPLRTTSPKKSWSRRWSGCENISRIQKFLRISHPSALLEVKSSIETGRDAGLVASQGVSSSQSIHTTNCKPFHTG